MLKEQQDTSEPVVEVVNYIDDFRESFEQNEPLPEKLQKFHNDFNGYDLDSEIKKRGRNRIESDLEKIDDLLQSEDVPSIIQKGVRKAQRINPSEEINPFAVYLIYAGPVSNAKAKDEGIIFNLGNFVNKGSKEDVYQLIESFSAHEATHRFLWQLGLRAKKGGDMDYRNLHSIWEEGLATTMQTVHLKTHEIFVKDIDFWINTVKNWIDAKGDKEKKKEILDSCLNRESFKEAYKRSNSVKELINKQEGIEEKFRAILIVGNGPAYHIGYVLWKRQLEKGKDITELVMKGDTQVLGWMEEYLEEVSE